MGVMVGGGHQPADIAPDDLLRPPAELAFRRGAERLDDPLLVDHHHGVGHRVEDRLQVGFALLQMGQRLRGAGRLTLQSPAAIGDGRTEQGEQAGVHQVGRVGEHGQAADRDAPRQGDGRGQQGRTRPPKGGGHQHGGHEQEEERAILEDRGQADPDAERGDRQHHRHRIARPGRSGRRLGGGGDDRGHSRALGVIARGRKHEALPLRRRNRRRA